MLLYRLNIMRYAVHIRHIEKRLSSAAPPATTRLDGHGHSNKNKVKNIYRLVNIKTNFKLVISNDHQIGKSSAKRAFAV